MAKRIITISREFGSGGRFIGEEVAKKLAVVMTERIQPELMTCEDIVATGRYPYTGKFGILSEKDWAYVQESR